jgi:ATP-dependent Zn protease
LLSANKIAEKMMNNLGMGKLGNIAGKKKGEKNMSAIDEEIKEVLKMAAAKSKEILIEHSNEILKYVLYLIL